MSAIMLADGVTISEFDKPYIIAEVNSSHNGNVENAKMLIDAAKNAGCDCVKFQSWNSKSLYSKTYYDKNPVAKRFVDRLSLSPNQLTELSAYCNEKRIGFSSTPYSNEEVDFLVDVCGVPFVKIASMEVNNPKYIEYIAAKGTPIILSTGMADYDEVKEAVKIIESAGNRNIVILHCVSLYPTRIEMANLRNILRLRELFPDYPIGFSDHTLGVESAVAAVALGAAVIEKHITLDAKKIGMDNQMAMEPEELNDLVMKCKRVPLALGSKERVLQPEEIKQRENMRRSIVTRIDLKVGQILEEKDLDVKRPGSGLEPKYIKDILGHRVNKNIEADSVLTAADIE